MATPHVGMKGSGPIRGKGKKPTLAKRIVGAAAQRGVDVMSAKVAPDVDIDAILTWPTRFNYGRFSPVFLSLSLAFLAGLVAIAAPPVSEIVVHHLPSWLTQDMVTHRKGWKEWLEFGEFGIEILIAVLLGEAAFAKHIHEEAETRFHRMQECALKQTEESLAKRRQQLKVSFESALAQMNRVIEEANWRNIPRALWRVAGAILALGKEINMFMPLHSIVPLEYQYFVAVRMIVAFPGGLSGLIAFLAFGSLCVVKLTIMYLGMIAPAAGGV